MSSAPPLRRLQRWFAYVMEHPGTAAQALRARPAEGLVPRRLVESGRVLTPNPRMEPAAMLDVYNGGYLARLVEVMQSDFGAVQHVIGDDAFRRLVARYLVKHPSRHPNLNALGRHFATFVRGERWLPHRAFLAELATLERATSVAFDAAEFTPLGPDAMSKVPPDRWDHVRFTPNPSVQLLSFRHPVDLFYQSWKNEKPIAVPRPAPSWLLVYRRDDRVWRQRMVRSEFRVLQRLCAGEPLAQALAAAKAGEPVAEWFQSFARDGLFVALSAGTSNKTRKRSSKRSPAKPRA